MSVFALGSEEVNDVKLPCIDGVERVVPVLDVSEVVALEQHIAREGTPLLELMKRAGAALTEVSMARLSEGGRIVVLAGSGNNGGDGWVAAQLLAKAGYDVVVIARTSPEDLSTEPARTAALEAAASGHFALEISPDDGWLQKVLQSASLIVDAILGTGFAHDQVREPYATWIEFANRLHRDKNILIVAADCPSGLNAQTGASAAQCIEADLTVTMLAPKRGLLESDAIPFVGDLLLAPLLASNSPVR